jgi:hypothetical protein
LQLLNCKQQRTVDKYVKTLLLAAESGPVIHLAKSFASKLNYFLRKTAAVIAKVYRIRYYIEGPNLLRHGRVTGLGEFLYKFPCC